MGLPHKEILILPTHLSAASLLTYAPDVISLNNERLASISGGVWASTLFEIHYSVTLLTPRSHRCYGVSRIPNAGRTLKHIHINTILSLENR